MVQSDFLLTCPGHKRCSGIARRQPQTYLDMTHAYGNLSQTVEHEGCRRQIAKEENAWQISDRRG